MSETQLIEDSINRVFADSVDRKLLESFDKGEKAGALWQTVCESGFQQVLVAEGKPANHWDEARPILRAIGYYRAPLPLAETLVANWLLARASLPSQDVALTLVDGSAMQMKLEGGALVISGTAKRVPWASDARHLVIGGQIDGQTVIGIADRGNVNLTPGRNIASEPRDDVRFENVRCSAFGTLGGVGENPVKAYGALARAVMIAGAAESVLDQSVQYAKDRVQFGRPIGKFQAVQHLLAELACEAAAASTSASVACQNAATAAGLLDIAAAKVRAGDAANHAARIAHAVHAAIGFTQEHTLHFGTRRLWSWRAEFGNEAHWSRQLGLLAIKGKRKNFWQEMTSPAVPNSA